MIVYASLKSADIKVSENSQHGVRMFKEFLEYCESLRLRDLGRVTGRGPDSDFEISVGRVLRDWGYSIESNLGVAGYFIDLVVRHPDRTGEYILGIECDGATYHSAKSARDRDRLRQDILEALGWKIHRIWSTDWIKCRDFETKRLHQALCSAIHSTLAST
jgi:very-short-patch-repair endonuclease